MGNNVNSRALGIGMACIAAIWGDPHDAVAQRARENAVTSAQDAFGTTVGNETIGLYSATDVRGFSPTEAGNLRIEGLYFDRQGDTTSRIVSGSTVRVGLSAQSYPFLAPTGIADYRLRIPGERRVTSAVATFGPYEMMNLEVDTQAPVITDKLSIGAGGGLIGERQATGTPSKVFNLGGIARWRPNERVEIVPFGAVNFRYDRENAHTVTTAGAFLPPVVDRSVYYGQDWLQLSSRQSAWGFVGRADLGDDWIFRTGWFRSWNHRLEQGENLFRNTQRDGRTDRFALILPGNSLGSWSGEANLARIITEGPRRHTLRAAFRGRIKERIFGGSTTIPLGPGILGVADREPLPTYALGPLSSSKVRQGNGGLTYEGLWPGVGEASFGIQKAFYNRRGEQPGLPDVVSRDSPVLVNGTAAAYVSDDLVFYGSYTRGLEESGEAPQNAANRGESVPATRTTQVDAGLRYALTPVLRFVAGVFEVKKPFFNLDTANIFTQVGNVRHRGTELSLAGEIIDGLTVVAGAVLLQARVTGQAVSAGRIGAVPLGRSPRVMRLNAQYKPAEWQGISIDGQIENISSRYADLLNTVRAPSYTTVNLGGRYPFKVRDKAATLRLQVLNVTNRFAWTVSPTATFLPIDQQRMVMSLAADF